jgi:glycosyltransferase involved in cell wall biosynthesis
MHCPNGFRKKPLHFERKNFLRKKAAFTGVANMTIVAVSKWIGELAAKSFFKEYPIEIRYNQIDKTTFCPTKSDFRDRYNLNGKKIILGVANVWVSEKGVADFLKLADSIKSDYVVVMVGLNKNKPKIPRSNVIWIDRTNNAKELAEIYTAADVFLNLTYEDTYPTVNLESQACGTPCITYRTGGSPESVPEENVVAQGDLKRVIERIYELCED